MVLRRLHTGGRQRIHLHQSFCIWQTDLVHAISSPRDYMVTFEPMSLIHVALNVQIHCHIVYGKQQILELLSLIFEFTHQLLMFTRLFHISKWQYNRQLGRIRRWKHCSYSAKYGSSREQRPWLMPTKAYIVELY